MSDDSRELERRLKQATASLGPEEDSQEPETAALRAGWLALGELLEAVQPQVEPALRRLPLPAKPRKRWLAVAMAAMAASLLIAVTATWYGWGTKPGATVSSPGAIANNSQVTPSPVKKHAPAVSRDADLAWDDSLDQEIASAGKAIAQVRQDQFASAAASNRVQYQMEILKKELDDNPL